MAWNKPSVKKVENKGESRPWNVSLKGIVAGLIVVVGAGIAAWWLWPQGGNAGEMSPSRSARQIKEVKPAAATKAKAEKEMPASTNRPPQQVGEIRDGYRLLPSGRLHKVYGVTTSRVARVSLEERTFERATDVAIAELLLVEPGTAWLGESKDYYKNFNKSFLKSLETPIIVGKEDTEEVRELKRSVIEMRKELKERLDAGEDLTAIMRETRDQMQQLALYRDELEKEVVKIATDKEDFSKKDIKELVDAANLMLKDRGVKPLSLNGPLAHKLRKAKLSRKNKEETRK